MKQMRQKGSDMYIGLVKFIQDSLKDKNNLIGLEIGSFNGESTKIFLDSGKFSKIYCIDPWDKIQPDKDGNLKTKGFFDLNCSSIKESEMFFDKQFSNDNRIVKLKGFSEEFTDKFKNEYFDFIYIDGDHSANGVMKDITNYYSKVKFGGVIGFHDYAVENENRFELIDAVNKYFGRFPKYVYKDDTAYFIKENRERNKKVIHTLTNNKMYRQTIAMLDSFFKYNKGYDAVIFCYDDVPLNDKYSIVNMKKYMDKTYPKYSDVEKIKSYRAKATIECLKIYSGALYCDSDLYFYDKIPEYSKTVFTLHDNHEINGMLNRINTGFVNLGYYYANNDNESKKWFTIVDDVYKSKKTGITVSLTDSKIWNQTFYQYMPYIFSNYEYEKNDGINISHWNLKERKVEEKDGLLMCNGNRLICFHFSHINDEFKNANDIVKKMIENYKREI